MAVDPNTGLYSLDTTLQPTGAMGAVISLLNAQRARQISDTLQQQREAQAQHEQEQADEYAAATQRAANLRQTMASQPEDVTPDRLVMAGLRSGNMDFGQAAPFLRAGESARARLGSAQTGAWGRAFDTLVRSGISPDAAAMTLNGQPALVSQLGGPETPQPSGTPESSKAAPVPAAAAAAGQARSALDITKARDITATQPSRIDLNKAKTAMLYAIGRLKQTQAAVDSKKVLSRDEFLSAQRAVNEVDKLLKPYLVDKWGYPVDQSEWTPEIMAYVQELKNRKQAILDHAAAKASPATGTQSPSPFGNTFSDMIPGGSAPQPAGASSTTPKTVTKSIILPE